MCQSPETEIFSSFSEKSFGEEKQWTYHHCNNCGMIFLEPDQRIDAQLEKSRYEHHQNLNDDPRYMEHLLRLWQPMQAHIHNAAKGLDYGSGPSPVMSQYLSEKSYDVRSWDVFYAKDPKVLEDSYDFIYCNEVVEHFYKPAEEFKKLAQLLKPNAIIGIGTKSFLGKKEDFKNWSYRRDDTHVCFYQEKTFQWICEEYGFALIEKGEDWWILQKLN